MVRRLRRRLGRGRHRGRRARARARWRRSASIVCLAGRNEQLESDLTSDVRGRAARARLRVHRQDARAAGGRRRARALHRRRHLPGGEGRGHAGRLLRAARRSRASEHARDGDARPAAPGQRHRRAARTRPGELRRGRATGSTRSPAGEARSRICWSATVAARARTVDGVGLAPCQRRRSRRGADRRPRHEDPPRSSSCSTLRGACARSRCGGCGWWRSPPRSCCC